MSTQDQNQYRNKLLDAALQIGGAACMAHWAFAGLAARIQSTGKPVQELTVGELLSAIEAHNEFHRDLADAFAQRPEQAS